MGIRSWKKEFYSPLSKVSRKGALAHALKKWIGLRASNLKRHGLKVGEYKDIFDIDEKSTFLADPRLYVDGSSCALCIHYDECDECPIFVATGTHCKDQFDKWYHSGDPEPMIRLLKRVEKTIG